MNRFPAICLLLVCSLTVQLACKKNDDTEKTEDQPSCNITTALSGWQLTEYEYPSYPEMTPLDLHFPTASYGVVVGSNGGMFRTKDGGASWQAYSSGIALDLTAVYYLDEQTGFIASGFRTDPARPGYVTGKGAYLARRQTESGAWERFFFPEYISFRDLLFFNKDEGIAKILTTDSLNALKFCRTTDGGKSWIPIDTMVKPISWADIKYNKDKLYIVGQEAGTIYTSSDKGISWEVMNTPIRVIIDIEPVTEDVIYLVAVATGYASFTILKTSDGGISWNTVMPTYFGGLKIHFNSVNEGFVIRQEYKIEGERADSRVVNKGYNVIQTTDGGASWLQAQPITACNNFFQGKYDFISPGMGYVIPAQSDEGTKIYSLIKL